MKRVLFVLIAASTMAALVGCAGDTKTVVETVTATATAAGSPGSASSNASTSSVAQTPAAATTTQRASSNSFVMPNERGKILQAAQDDIQRVSGNPIFFTYSSDATGQGRSQIIDSNWQVCSQNIPAGTTVDASAHITFSVVRTTERCP